MKRSIPLFATLFLAACAGGGVSSNGVSLGIGLGGMLGNHVGIGTSVNIPLGNNTPASNNSTIQTIQEQIIHFDAHGQSTDSATKNGYRRKILTKQSDGNYLVQDFYEMGGAKRTDPMQLSRDQLHTFRAAPANGTLTVYAINGTVMQQQTYQNGKLIK